MYEENEKESEMWVKELSAKIYRQTLELKW